jgi:UDP-N-acetylglucosamine 2-epimerase (non-hydrolysing)
MKNTRIAIVLGTRPEIVKCAPIIRACIEQNIDHFVVHTGQHYSENMDAVFFADLGLPKPHYNLSVGSGSHGAQTGTMVTRIEELFVKEKPTAVCVQGDTNTALAGALAAVKLHIPVAHIEAGLRSFDRKMPEEINRVLIDHMSEWLFVPTPSAAQQARAEGIPQDRVHISGNTVVDALLQHIEIAQKESSVLAQHKLAKQQYIVATVHRAENTDVAERLENIVAGIIAVAEDTQLPVVWPMHPRTRAVLNASGLGDRIDAHQLVRCVEPVGYLDFLLLQSSAKLILTDSGGIQEESCILRVPCVTLRDNTERPESVTVGANVLAGANTQSIRDAAQSMLKKSTDWNSPFGDGKSAQYILEGIVCGARTYLNVAFETKRSSATPR